jgi:hypothetical protein
MNPMAHTMAQQYAHQNQLNNQQGVNHPMHPMNRPQCEPIGIQTKSMDTQSSLNNKPSKKELEDTLSKLETIPEDSTPQPTKKLLKPSVKKPAASEPNIKISEIKNDDKLDNTLSAKFYRNMQQNLDLDKADSDEEEDRESQD